MVQIQLNLSEKQDKIVKDHKHKNDLPTKVKAVLDIIDKHAK